MAGHRPVHFIHPEIESAVSLHRLEVHSNGEIGKLLVCHQQAMAGFGVPRCNHRRTIHLPAATIRDMPAFKVAIQHGLPLVVTQVTNPDVPPLDLEWVLPATDRVDLQADETCQGQGVHEVRNGDTVHPGPQGVTDGHDSIVIPVVLPERLPCDCGIWRRIQPPPPALIVNSRRIGPVGGIDLNLLPMNPPPSIRGKTVAADLDPRVESLINLEIEFQLEIAVVPVGAKERIRSVGAGAAHYGPVHDLVNRLASKTASTTGTVAGSSGPSCSRQAPLTGFLRIPRPSISTSMTSPSAR